MVLLLFSEKEKQNQLEERLAYDMFLKDKYEINETVFK